MLRRALALGLTLIACRTQTPTRPAEAPAASKAAPGDASARVRAAKITVLSTMLADRGIGEWGFAALVEADGRRILFDTGARPDTVLKNVETLGVDLRTVTDVVLSHHHDDHVGGLMTLRAAVLEKQSPTALATVHVGAGIFEPRRVDGRDVNSMVEIRRAFEATGGTFVVHAEAGQIGPGIWVTGPVPRVHPERNWSGARKVERDGVWVDDTLVEDQSLVLDTDRGLVVLAGCGHAGIVNTVTHARAKIREAPVHAAIGGFHLLDANDEQLAWTARQLGAVGLAQFYGGHCTGLEAVFRFREALGLRREDSLVAAVGGSYVLGEGIAPGALAH